MKIIKLKAARGWTWVKQGYQLIMRSPLLSVTLALIGTLFMFFLSKLPLLGPLLAVLLFPVVLAGYMRVCRALEEDEEVELMHLFDGFKKHLAGLIALGSFLILGLLAAATAIITIGGEALRTLFEKLNATADPQMQMELMLAAGPEVSLSITVGLALFCILGLAFQYAPMLVFFSGMPPFAALRASVSGILRNIFPYTVYALIMLTIGGVLDILPFNLGLLVLLPLGFTSLYVSYRNIFPFADEVAPHQHAVPDTKA